MPDVDRSHLPIRRPSFAGSRQPDARRIAAGLEPHRPSHAARWRAERPARAHRRRRLRQPEHVRRPDPDAELHPDGRGRRPLQPLPRHGHLLADAGGPAHRPQQPRRRLRLRRRVRRRLPGLLRHAAPRLRAAAADPARQRLHHGRVRQVAPDTRRPAGSGRTVRPLADRLGLRVLLRLPRRRRRAVGHGPRREPEDHRRRSRATATRTDPYYLPDAMADKTIEWLHGIRAQDAKKPFFAYFSTGCSHAPHHVAESWAAKYKGKFDQGWDRLREETFARQKALGVVPPEAELTPRNEAFPAWDDVPDKLKPFYARQMEVYAGFSENADHNVGRVIDAIDELGELDNTLDHLDLGRQRREHGGHRHRLVQRADDAERHPADRRDAAPAVRALRRDGRLGRGDHGAALRRRLGLGRQHALPVGQAGRLAPRRDAQPDGHPLAGPRRRRGAGSGRSSPTSSTSRRPSSTSPASRRRRPSTASTSSRSTGSPSPTA